MQPLSNGTSNRKRLGCRFCPWSTLLWRTSADGNPISGWPALARHVERAHPDVEFDLLAVLDGEDCEVE